MSRLNEPIEIPERVNVARHFLTRRLEDGAGERIALRLDERQLTYLEVERLAARFGNVLAEMGARREERVMITLPDGPEWVGAFFGTLKLGAVVVMVNPRLEEEPLARLLEYVEPRWAVVDAGLGDRGSGEVFAEACRRVDRPPTPLAVGGALDGAPRYEAFAAHVGDSLEAVPTHRDDAAIWLFSGGTTGLPKGVVQTHASFINTTELYAKRALGYNADDITLSVPKLYFGYATGSNLLFPFSV
ncbi:MAG: AMP-binding protein, partial [Thermoanaerobaculia bacterium]|nr:AMP-binding protein [Thermoanaerobaculia bacterium]